MVLGLALAQARISHNWPRLVKSLPQVVGPQVVGPQVVGPQLLEPKIFESSRWINWYCRTF